MRHELLLAPGTVESSPSFSTSPNQVLNKPRCGPCFPPPLGGAQGALEGRGFTGGHAAWTGPGHARGRGSRWVPGQAVRPIRSSPLGTGRPSHRQGGLQRWDRTPSAVWGGQAGSAPYLFFKPAGFTGTANTNDRSGISPRLTV